MSSLKLVIGNKNYSTWSLRPWLVLRHVGAPFEYMQTMLDLPAMKDWEDAARSEPYTIPKFE